MAFLWKALGFPTTVPNFPYTPVTEDDNKLCYGTSHTFGVEWTVQRGKATEENNTEVLIFSTSLKVKPQSTSASTSSFSSLSMTQVNSLIPSLAQNCLQRAKSLKLPGLLRCYGGTVYNNTVYIATEFATPLHLYFKNNNNNTQGEVNVNYENSVALGLKSITTAVASLHKNNLIHRNVNMHSVYVTAGGLWKLFGFELIMSLESMTSNEVALQQNIQLYLSALRMQIKQMEMNGGYSSNYVGVGLEQQDEHEAMIHLHEWPPERETNLNNNNVSSKVEISEDAWGVGCLIYEAFAYAPASLYSTPQPSNKSITGNNTTTNNIFMHNRNNTSNSMNMMEEHNKIRNFTRFLPATLQPSYVNLLETNSSKRLSVVKFIDTCDFINTNNYVHVMTSLEMLPVMSKVNREQFCDDLHQRIPSFPLEACLYSILPSLTNSLQFGAVANVVEPIMAIISRLHSSNTNINCKEKTENEIFVKLVEPSLITLYTCDDPLLRLRLLQHSKCYANQLSMSTLQNKLWPLYLKGFTHSHAMVQEATARALVHFAPLLQSTSLLVKDAIPALASLQHHADGAIRTNATICLCKIAQYINTSNKSTLLLSGLARMLKDPFVPSRLAAIRGLYTLIAIFTPQQCAMQVLPAIPALTLDKEKEIREFAIKLLREITNVLQRASQEQDERELLVENKTTPSIISQQSSLENRPENISIQTNSATQTTRASLSMSSPLTIHQLNSFTNNNLNVNTNNTYNNSKEVKINTGDINSNYNNYFAGQQSYNATNDSNSSCTMKTINSTSELPTPSASSSGFYSPEQARSANFNLNNTNGNTTININNNDNTTLSNYNNNTNHNNHNHSRSNSNMWAEDVSESSDTIPQVQLPFQQSFNSPLPLHLSPKQHNHNNNNNIVNVNKFTPFNNKTPPNAVNKNISNNKKNAISISKTNGNSTYHDYPHQPNQQQQEYNVNNNTQSHNEDVNEENDGWSDEDDDQHEGDMKCNNKSVNNNDNIYKTETNTRAAENNKNELFTKSNALLPSKTESSLSYNNAIDVKQFNNESSVASSSQFVSTSPFTTSHSSTTFSSIVVSVASKDNNANQTNYCNSFTTMNNDNNNSNKTISKPITTTTSNTNVNMKPRKKAGGLGAAKIS